MASPQFVSRRFPFERPGQRPSGRDGNTLLGHNEACVRIVLNVDVKPTIHRFISVIPNRHRELHGLFGIVSHPVCRNVEHNCVGCIRSMMTHDREKKEKLRALVHWRS